MRVIVQYFLGELSDEQADELENRYFIDDGLFKQFLVVQEALVDAYVRNQLNQHERELFVRNFLISPERNQQVALAQALRQHFALPKPYWWHMSLDFLRTPAFAVSLVLALLAGGVWWLWQKSSPSKTSKDGRVVRNDSSTPTRPDSPTVVTSPTVSPSPIQSPRSSSAPVRSTPPPPSTTLATLLLPFSPSRAGEQTDDKQRIEQIPLTPGIARLLLELSLRGTSDSSTIYRVALHQTKGNKEIKVWDESGFRATAPTVTGQSVFVEIPTARLEAGEYTLKLSRVKAGRRSTPYKFRLVHP